MDITLSALLIEPMKRDLALSDVQIGLVQGTAYGVAYGLSSVPMGRLIDVGRRTRLMTAGVLVWSAALVGMALAHRVVGLMGCRVILGMTTALLIPASISLVSDLFPPQARSVAASLFAAGQACGQALGVLAGGLVFDALGRFIAAHPRSLGGLPPWRLLYLGASALCLVLVPLLAAMPEPARRERVADARTWRSAATALWAYRGFIVPLIAALVFGMIASQAASTWTAPVLMRRFGQSPGQFAGWLSAVTLGGGIAGALAGGRLAELGRRRGGARGVLLPPAVVAVASVPLALFALAPTLPLFAVMLALTLFCSGLIPTVGMIAFTLNLPNEIRGLGIGTYVMAAALFGMGVAPAVIALVSQALGGEPMLGDAIALVAAPSMLASACCFGVAILGGGGAPRTPA
jgi:MFS family permease